MTTKRPQVGQLIVDGARPAVARVAALPAAYRLSPAETAVLLALACDSFDGATSAPGWDNLAAWTHMHRSSVSVVVQRLTVPNLHRPALIATESTRGRNRVIFRLLLPEPSSDTGRLPNHPAGPDGSTAEPSANRPANRPATPDAPFPSPPSASSTSEVTTDRAPADDDAGIVGAARRVAAVADGAGKRWGERGIAKYLRTLVQDMTLADAEGQAARSASDPGAKTPEAITFEKYQATRPAVEQPSEPTCRVCGLTRTGHDRNRDNTGDPHGWEPVGGESASTGESPNPQEEQVGEVEKGPADEPLPEQPGQDQPDAGSDQQPAKPASDQQPAKPASEQQTAPPAGPPAAPGAEPRNGRADPSAGQQSRPKPQSSCEWLAAQLGDQAPVRVPVTRAAPAA